MIRYVLVCAIGLVAATGAIAQTSPNPSGGGNKSATTSKISKQTTSFIRQAAEGGQFEVASGNIAQQKSETADVKAFAQQLIDDHTAANQQLVAAAQQAGATVPNVTLQKKHADVISELRRKSGRALDRAFVNAQVTAHQETVQAFERYKASGDNAQLKHFAESTLPKLRQHLDHAKELKQSIDGSAATGSSSGTSSTGKKK